MFVCMFVFVCAEERCDTQEDKARRSDETRQENEVRTQVGG